MKALIILIIMLIPAVVFAQSAITFEEEQHDFGKVKEGEPLDYTFQFTNTGTTDLIIERLSAT